MRILDFLNPAYLTAMYKAGTSIHLVSPPGIGKSSICNNEVPDILSEALGQPFGRHTEMVTTLDAPDFRGFLVPGKDKAGNPISFFTRPGVIPSDEYLSQYPCGVYNLDERGQGQPLVQCASAPMVLSRQAGNFYLPKGWWVISQSNRMEDRANVVRPPMHLVNRERTIELEFDITSSAVYWERTGMHPMGVAYAKSNPGIFVDAVPKEPKPYCTPRSFTETWKLLAELAGTDEQGNPNMHVPNNTIIQEMVAGDIGEGTASQMFAYFKVADQLPTIEQIMRDPYTCKAPDRLDSGYAAVQMCIHHAKPGNVDKLWTFIERLPLELQTSACKSLIERSGGVLMNSKALTTWLAKHKALVISSNA